MTNLTSASQVKQLLARHGLRPKKRLGQNFLVDRNVVDHIVSASGAGPGSRVLEIGPGLGVLTQALAAAGARVVAVEADKSLAPVLDETLADSNVELILEDFLKIDLPDFLRERSGDEKWSIVGNLPYYITTPIIVKLVESKQLLSDVLVMMQREVADRLGGSPGSESYGSISVLVNYHFEQHGVMRVSRNVFYPAPEVDSEVIRLTPRPAPPVYVRDEGLLFRIVRASFGKRRKTLANALSTAPELGWGRDQTVAALTAAGIDPGRRGETLSLQEFADVANASEAV